MSVLNALLSVLLFTSFQVNAMDEADIPAPSRPEYLQAEEDFEDGKSLNDNPSNGIDGQSEAEVKQEFLNMANELDSDTSFDQSQAPTEAAYEEPLEAIADASDPLGQNPEINSEEKLAGMEEQLEEAEATHEEILAGQRQPASNQPFKPGMYKFKSDCKMYAEPSSMSASAGSVSMGSKLWVDGHDSKWMKVYKKAGPAYIPATCFN